MKHKWKEIDDIAALYVYRFCNNENEIKRRSKELSISEDSFKMKIQNFVYLEKGEGGLSHCSEQSKRIYGEYKDKSKEEFDLKTE